MCKNDSDNIEIALQARQVIVSGRSRDANDPLLCHVHIIDLKLAELFKQHKIFSCTSDPFEARIFSFYENAARELLIRHPLDQQPGVSTVSAVHLVVVGFGQMGESVALQAARIGHFASGQRLRITVFDPDADHRRLNLLARYPQLEQVVDLTFDSRNVEHPTVRQQLTEWAASDRERLVVTIAIDDNPRALSIALNLPAALRDRSVPVFVRQSEQRGLATLIDDRVADGSVAANVTSFGSPEVSAGLEQILQERLDVLARAIHERYVAQRVPAEPSPRPTRPSPPGNSSMPASRVPTASKPTISTSSSAPHIAYGWPRGSRRLTERRRLRASRKMKSSCSPTWSTPAGAPTVISAAGATARPPTSREDQPLPHPLRPAYRRDQAIRPRAVLQIPGTN